MSPRNVRWIGAVAVSLAVGVVGSLQAQTELEVGAFGGLFVPTSDFAISPDPGSFPIGQASAKASTAFTYGVVGRAWLADRLGVQATLGFTDGSLVVQSPFGTAPDTTYPASSTAVTAALLYRFTTPTIQNTVWVSAGVVFLSQDSPHFAPYQASTGIGPTFGAGSTLPLGDRWRVNLMLDAFIYSFNLEAPGAETLSSSQFDLRAVAGMSYRLGR
jgi:hypothetical protein